jgi:hypothetical protein
MTELRTAVVAVAVCPDRARVTRSGTMALEVVRFDFAVEHPRAMGLVGLLRGYSE